MWTFRCYSVYTHLSRCLFMMLNAFMVVSVSRGTDNNAKLHHGNYHSVGKPRD